VNPAPAIINYSHNAYNFIIPRYYLVSRHYSIYQNGIKIDIFVNELEVHVTVRLISVRSGNISILDVYIQFIIL
jgi:hypothetical protein